MKEPIISIKHVNKSFYGVTVLRDISFDIYPGQVLALLGQNGAGKSVLMKILTGVIPRNQYEGEITCEGRPLAFANINDADKEGIYMIPQEIEVFPNLTVAENLFFSNIGTQGLIRWNNLFSEARKALNMFHLTIDPKAKMGSITRAQQQLLLITRALIQSLGNARAKVLVLDEPTASLTYSEAEVLFRYIEQIKKQGIACLFISHRMNEVFRISDRICVLRDGVLAGDYVTAETGADEVIAAMIGKNLNRIQREKPPDATKCMLQVKDRTVYHPHFQDRAVIDKISFELYAGRILGVYGLVGSGKTELALSIFGAWSGKSSGQIYIEGKEVSILSTKDAVKNGIGFLPEGRRQAIMSVRNIRENMSLMSLDQLRGTGSFLRLKLEKKETQELSKTLHLKADSLEAYPSSLSGGNMQKLLVARMLGAKSRILIIDEPTVGVDINARQDIYSTLRRLAKEENCAILVFSSDVDEIVELSDEIMVIQNGKRKIFWSAEEICKGDITEEIVLKYASGV